MNVDFQNNSVYPVGLLSSTIDPDKLPSNPIFMVNITEVSQIETPLSVNFLGLVFVLISNLVTILSRGTDRLHSL